jgi:hypothetical protein
LRATTTTKPRYLKPKHDNSWTSHDRNWLDDPELDKLSTTHSDNHQTGNTKKVDPWHRSESTSKNGGGYGTYDHTQNSDTSKIPTEEPEKATEPDEEEDFPRRVFVDNNPDFPDAPHGHHKEPATDKPTVKPRTTARLKLNTPTKGEVLDFYHIQLIQKRFPPKPYTMNYEHARDAG